MIDGSSPQVTLDLQREGGVSTKGPRGGVFVMYNCARLHTLFDSYERGVEKGEKCFTCRHKLLGSIPISINIYTLLVGFLLQNA